MHCILAVVYTQVHFWLYICCDTQYYWLVFTSCKLEKICTGFALYFFSTTYSLQRQYTGYNQCCFILAMFNTDDILLVYILFLYWKFWLTSVRQYYIWRIIYMHIQMEPLKFSEDEELVLSTSRDLSPWAVLSLTVHWTQWLWFPKIHRIMNIEPWHFGCGAATYSVLVVYSLAPHHSALVVRGFCGTVRGLIPPSSDAESNNQAFSFSQSICIAGRSTASFSLLPQTVTVRFCVITIGFPLSLPW